MAGRRPLKTRSFHGQSVIQFNAGNKDVTAGIIRPDSGSYDHRRDFTRPKSKSSAAQIEKPLRSSRVNTFKIGEPTMSNKITFAAVAALLAVSSVQGTASAQSYTTQHKSAHRSVERVPLDARASAGRVIPSRASRDAFEGAYGASGGTISGKVNPDRVFPNQMGGLPASTPNGY